MHKYRKLKENLHSHFAQKQTASCQPDQPDLKKIKNEIREEFRKKCYKKQVNVLPLCDASSTQTCI